MESGDPRLLEWLRKPSDPEQMLTTVRAARAAGVSVAVIVLIGAGGESFFADHVRHTVELIRNMQLGRGDFIYLSPLVAAEKTEYQQLMEMDNIQPLTPQRMAEQEQQIRSGIHSAAYTAHYEVENFVY